MVMGHELIHAHRAANGFIVPRSQTTYHGFRLPDGSWRSIQNHSVEELQTIGIMTFCRVTYPFLNTYFLFVPGGLSENALRREHGLPRRLTWARH